MGLYQNHLNANDYEAMNLLTAPSASQVRRQPIEKRSPRSRVLAQIAPPHYAYAYRWFQIVCMAANRFVVIFVSQRNTLRSMLAQACLSHIGGDRFAAYSCGQPGRVGDRIHPAALSALSTARMAAPLHPPRNWGELTLGDSPRANFVITLDADTFTLQPRWPGQPDSALWSFPDIAGMEDPEAAAHAALQMLYALRRRLELMTSLPLQAADREAIRSDVRDLANMQ